MNDQECTQAYELLIEILNQSHLGWVVSQVVEEVRLGKTVEQERETLRESHGQLVTHIPDDYRRSLRKGPKATFPVTIEYQPAERLKLLLDAVEEVVVKTADMENHFLRFFHDEPDSQFRIIFQSEEPSSTQIVIDEQMMLSVLDSVKHLKELLDALRKEIET